uniref:Uncharacterized protein n=1 Tax=Clastoptera arizonana TaxID=38151 RepID=A0A1B6CFQ9_9HEMI
MSNKNSIRLIIELPLKLANNYLEIFKVKPLPYYDADLDKFMYVKSETEYFAVTSDGQWFTYLLGSEFKECVETSYGLCQLNKPLYPTADGNSCDYAMFIGEEEKSREFFVRG